MDDFLDFLDKLEIMLKSFPSDQSDNLELVRQKRKELNKESKIF